MSHLLGYIAVYDCWDRVVVSWNVTDADEPRGGLYARSCGRDEFQGEGATSHQEWLKGALTGLIEVL